MTTFSCENYFSDPIDPRVETVAIESVFVSPAIINSDTINVGPERKPEDILPIRLLLMANVHQVTPRPAFVRYSLKNPDRGITVASGLLRNDGVIPDAASNDSIYTGYVQFTMVRAQLVTLELEVWPEDRNGNRGTGRVLSVPIVRSNEPPLLSDLVAPDTVQIGGQSRTILLQIKAVDPDGLADIRRVFFNSFRPDGSPSSGNPFSMFDDGNSAGSGDPVAGDGIYSLRVLLPSTTSPGRYRFEFEAVDRSNAASNIILHFITVVP